MRLASLAWPRPFVWQLVGRMKEEEGRRDWWLWTGCCWLWRNAGRANQIAERLWYAIFRRISASSAWLDYGEKHQGGWTKQSCFFSGYAGTLQALKHKQNEAVKENVSGRTSSWLFPQVPASLYAMLCYPAAINVKSPCV